MLKKISCNIFLQKEIVFHEGLNAIVGDDIASNSIGKSTMLMIIDFVFGGDDYISKNHDVVDNLGHHDFRFIFNFDNKDYYFIRSTNEYKFVSICNEKFEILQSVTTEEFTAWLQEKYDCQLESLTFRNIVGRYFRIYGKENLNERKPIQYFEKETAPKSILALLKLFDKYKSLKAYEEQIEKLKSDKTTLVDAAKKNFLPNVNTKSLFNKNEKKIEELSVRLEKIKKEIVTTSLDLESMVSQEILKLKREKSQLTIKLNSYQVLKRFSGVDIIAGGPPCQGFSVAGPSQYGIIDKRNTLIMEFFRIITVLKPRYCILENVKGILNGKMNASQKALETYKSELEKIGYQNKVFVLQAADFGVPQYRERVVVVSALGDNILPNQIEGQYKGQENWVTVKDVFGDLPDIDAGEGTNDSVPYKTAPQSEYQRYIREGSTGVCNHVAMKHTPRLIARFAQIPQGGSLLDVPAEFGQRQRNGNELDVKKRSGIS